MQTAVSTTTGNKLRNIASAIGALFKPKMQQRSLSPVSDRGWLKIFDWAPGRWQQDAPPISTDRVLAHWAVYACISLIAGDVGKLRLRLVEKDEDGIWSEVRSAAFGPVLRKPNAYQTRQKFIEQWIISLLTNGNTYVLKERDARGIVVAMYVLDPYLVTPLIAPNGWVFYQLGHDDLAQVRGGDDAKVPASEIIHDRAACLFHPLVGVSPLFACGLAAQQGLSIQRNSESFFRNQSMPGGMLLAPGEISDETAERLKVHWETNYSGRNAGRTAVLGDGLKFEPLNVNARDALLVDQLKLTATMVCSAYHVPPFKIGLETLPAGQKVEDMNRIYYADCLQTLIESIEALLDEGLGLDLTGRAFGTEFDLDGLLKMDSASLVTSLRDAVGAGVMSPNEARAKMNLPPVEGGETPYMQHQDYSLGALSRRDALPNPFSPTGSAPAPAPNPNEVEAEMQRRLEVERRTTEERIRAEYTARAEAEAKARADAERESTARLDQERRDAEERAAREQEMRAENDTRVRMAAEREASALLDRIRVGLGG